MPTPEAFDYLIDLLTKHREKITKIRLNRSIVEVLRPNLSEYIREFSVLDGTTVVIEIDGGANGGAVTVPPEVWKDL